MMTEEKTIVQSERIVPPGQFNPIRIASCVERKWETINGREAYIATGNIKKDFEWILEDGVKVCEYLHGINLGIQIIDKKVVRAFTRHNIDCDFFSMNGLHHAVNYSIQNIIPHIDANDHVIFGTLIGAAANQIENFITRDNQKHNLTYTQWGKYPKTIDNISTWLREDLSSYFDNDFLYNSKCGAPKDKNARDRRLVKYFSGHIQRPYGIMFCHKDGRYARIDCNSFRWYYEENLGKASNKKKKRHFMTKEQWESLGEKEREAVRNVCRAKRTVRS